MDTTLRKLASLKLTVGLILVIVLVLGAGTILESRSGAEAARAVYYSTWFISLLGLFAINLTCSLLIRWPWGRNMVGFGLTHGGMVIILVGAAGSYLLKDEGQLALWEGETSNVYLASEGPMGRVERPLPFSVRLEAFEIDHYPGTQRPAMFRSRVVVTDSAAGLEFPAVIEMNRELTYANFSLFQSSYQRTAERDMTVLSVSRDPGQPIVFGGYILLVMGMITVLSTRISTRRNRGRRKKLGTVALLAWGGIASAAFSPSIARAIELPAPDDVESLRTLPVQHDGRVMPLDTAAREAVWQLTGHKGYNGVDPIALVLGWAFASQDWEAEPVVAIGEQSIREVLGLPRGVRNVSYATLISNQRLLELFRQRSAYDQEGRDLSPLLEDVKELELRLGWVHDLHHRSLLRAVPASSDPEAAWAVPESVTSTADLKQLYLEQRASGSSVYPSERAMAREVLYNKVRPTRVAWWILVPATLASLLVWLGRPRKWLDVAAIGGLVAGFAVMSWGLMVRWQCAGRIPASNMYESLLFLGWGVGLFAIIATVFLHNRLVIFNATAMSALTMALVDLLPIDPFIHPMPPVLAGTPWLAIHVPIIMVGYSVFALAVLVAHLQVGMEIFAPTRKAAAARMNDLLYWYMHIGSILLIAGILTGSIWAASSWGRYWGWDPKEVWSLIAFLVYMAILHARLERFIGPFGVAAANIVAFGAILMTYLGVNYVLAAGLHSYGFGGSKVAQSMVIVGVIEVLYLGAGFAARVRNRRAEGQTTTS